MDKEHEPINNPDFKPIEFNRFKPASNTKDMNKQNKAPVAHKC